MSAPTATRRTRTRRPSPARRRRLPHWGWWITGLVTVIAAAQTWPLYTGLAFALTATAAIIAVVRPRRLTRALTWADTIATTINAHRNHLPAPGHRTLAAFQRMRPDQFEHAIAALAREDRHHVAHAERVGGANDRGADVIATLRDGRRILIQAKHYQPGHNVGSDTIQTTNGVYRDIHHCHHAVIVTTAAFTRDAHHTNTLLPTPIRLIDGPALEAWANNGHAPW
ncbi:restriction endonuclease [Streptomyces griseorubiginosus]|uniref:restriction endonuclease n=1 Tax=Streptomyces griseorubiginosus TaxID=67304 RepID=UPI003408C434